MKYEIPYARIATSIPIATTIATGILITMIKKNRNSMTQLAKYATPTPIKITANRAINGLNLDIQISPFLSSTKIFKLLIIIIVYNQKNIYPIP